MANVKKEPRKSTTVYLNDQAKKKLARSMAKEHKGLSGSDIINELIIKHL